MINVKSGKQWTVKKNASLHWRKSSLMVLMVKKITKEVLSIYQIERDIFFFSCGTSESIGSVFRQQFKKSWRFIFLFVYDIDICTARQTLSNRCWCSPYTGLCQPLNVSTCNFFNLSIIQMDNISICQYLIRQYFNM